MQNFNLKDKKTKTERNQNNLNDGLSAEDTVIMVSFVVVCVLQVLHILARLSHYLSGNQNRGVEPDINQRKRSRDAYNKKLLIAMPCSSEVITSREAETIKEETGNQKETVVENNRNAQTNDLSHYVLLFVCLFYYSLKTPVTVPSDLFQNRKEGNNSKEPDEPNDNNSSGLGL